MLKVGHAVAGARHPCPKSHVIVDPVLDIHGSSTASEWGSSFSAA